MSLERLKPLAAAALVLALAVGPAAALAKPRAAISEQQELVNKARATFLHFREDPNLTGFREHETEARGFLIVPTAVRAGLVLGGSGGRCVVVSRNRDDSWNGPSFCRVGTASFGLQAGVDVSEIVVLVMTQRGMNALLSASFRPGVDASVAAGPVGIGAGRAPRPTADFLYYTRSKGLYGGVSLEGAMIRPADGWNRAYYGRTVSPREILVSGSCRNPGSKPLLETMEYSLRVAARH